MRAYTGLTWDHPRGRDALVAAAALHAGELAIEWDTQPLEGFESTPIAGLAERYDVLVLDHPHLGEAVAAGCLVPLEELVADDVLAGIVAATVGRSAASYVLDGRTWALPLDVATQVLVAHPALLGDRPLPTTWFDVLELGDELPIALSLGGPHALLTLYSLCVALGEPPASGPEAAEPVPRETGVRALELLAELEARSVPALATANPIGILEAMARSRAAACCPLVYGYSSYARAGDGREALRFGDAPSLGSTLGGTGLAITRRGPIERDLVQHLLWLLDEGTQRDFIPRHTGQPSHRAAWADPAVDDAWGGFYGATARTSEAAWVRPRHAGYIRFQDEGSAIVRAGLAEGRRPARVLDELARCWRASLPRAVTT